jgi:hypothetical protein
MDCVKEYQNIVHIKALMDRDATPCSLVLYLSMTCRSNARLATVRTDETASEASAALLANRLLVSSVSLNSSLMRRYPHNTIFES